MDNIFLMTKYSTIYTTGFNHFRRRAPFMLLAICGALLLGSCSTNPATGDRQFTALMSPSQENQVGASEHSKIIQQFGLYKNSALSAYVNEIGQRVVKKTERPEVKYQFHIIDSPIVNAFALPGGYIYVSRGLIALANNEAELAAVLGHEAAHITARHSAERYSQSVVTSLGAGILSAAIGDKGVSQALGIGSNLYLSSYSRGQENQADTLGIRYLDHAGYNPGAMTAFLSNLQNNTALDAKIAGKKATGGGYFSTHPATSDRISKTVQEARQYPDHDVYFRERYLKKIKGLTYGDSVEQGFARGSSFIHPKMGFTFDAPNGYRIINQPTQVIATGADKSIFVFDIANNPQGQDVLSYMQQNWMKGEAISRPERVTVNGMKAATSAFSGSVNGQAVTIRLMAIEWAPNKIARFQMSIPRGASKAQIESLKKASYSFRRLSEVEKIKLKPYRIHVVAAKPGDTVATLAARMPYKDKFNIDRVRVLNGLSARDSLQAGRLYKIVTAQ